MSKSATRWERAGLLAVFASIGAAIAAALYLAFVPIYEGYGTVAALNGSGIYVILFVPVVLALLPLVIRDPQARSSATWFSGVVTIGLSALGMFSIGMFYMPAACSLLLAAVLLSLGGTERRTEGRSTQPHA